MLANRVLAPLSILALLRTISEIIGKATNKSGERIAHPDGKQITVVVGFSVPRINRVDGFGAQQRFHTPNQGKHHDVLQPYGREYAREVWKGDGAEHVVGDVDQKFFSKRILAAAEQIGTVLTKIEE